MIELKFTEVTRNRNGKPVTGRLYDTGISEIFLPDLKTKKEVIDFFNGAGILTKKGKLTAPYSRGLKVKTKESRALVK
ncbi:hypothetical protein FACS189434_06860 [Bacteroidia bacterium]|nr:hypothetical protein FACS189434_06860 [Bacteroidia bacterium]